MQCPNCNATYTSGNKCPSCNIDTVLYMGITRLSNKLYNQGLERLRNADFTYGIEALKKSVNVNKNNVPARNLLGLALFEVGHVGEALMHWVVSTSLLKEDNPASDYIEKVHKNARNLEKLNDAVGMYNQALGHIKQKSDDLAIIQLKKAVETNPRFVDAINLLTLCYLIQSDKDRAAASVERVLTLDVQNPGALSYYSVLNPGRSRPSLIRQNTAPRRQVPAQNTSYKALQEKKATNFHISEILSFVLGVISAAAIIYFLIIPALQSEGDAEVARVRQQLEAAQLTHEAILEDTNERTAIMAESMEGLQAEITNLEAARELQDRIIRVHHAYRLFSENQLQESIDRIENIDTAGLPPDIIGYMEDIRAGAYPQLGATHFTVGQQAFNGNDHYLALVNLELAFRFLDETSTNWNELLFLLGSIYYSDGRLEEAQGLISALRERAPNHRPVLSTNMLNSINAQLEPEEE